MNTTQIITGRGEVITQNERMFVGPDSVGPLAGPMVSEPQVIPSLGVLGQEFDSSFEPLDGKDIMAFPNQTLSFQKRTWTCQAYNRTTRVRQGLSRSTILSSVPFFVASVSLAGSIQRSECHETLELEL